MEIIIAGPRDLDVPVSTIYSVMFKAGFEPTCIIHGGCRGVDASGKAYAEALGIPVLCFPAEWYRYGKGAGPIRNKTMAEQADALLVFVHASKPVTSGTASMIAEAVRAGIKIFLWEV